MALGCSLPPSATCVFRKKHKRCGVFSKISTVAESEDSQESVDSVTDSQKRREILSRRPSYRQVKKRHPRIQQQLPLHTNFVPDVCLSLLTGRSLTIYRRTLPRCLESKKRSPRTTLPPPSPRLPCPLPSIRPAAASTVSVSFLGRCQRGVWVPCSHVGVFRQSPSLKVGRSSWPTTAQTACRVCRR